MDKRSTLALEGINTRLAKVVQTASEICTIPFIVTEGLRTLDRQKKLVAEGRSKTLKSKHLLGLAVDIIPIIDGKDVWTYLKNRPLDDRAKEGFRNIRNAMLTASLYHEVKLRWGNDWDGDGIEVGPDPDESFEDWPHFEIRL